LFIIPQRPRNANSREMPQMPALLVKPGPGERETRDMTRASSDLTKKNVYGTIFT
jgi:hypothetical protein